MLATNVPSLLSGSTVAVLPQQKRPLLLEGIWPKPTFRSASVPGFNWMNGGRYYLTLESGRLVQQIVTARHVTQTVV